jgi:hypothetical protein
LVAESRTVEAAIARLSVSSLWLEKDDTEVLRTMAKPRMDPSAFVGKLLEEQDAAATTARRAPRAAPGHR